MPELPKEIVERLQPDQQEEIQDVLAAGADTRTDPDTFEEIFLGLTSDDTNERLQWARKPLFSYRSVLSAKDFANLVMIQRNISPIGGYPIEGVGHPIGTLDEHTELAVALAAAGYLGPMAAPLARQVYRAGRQAFGEDLAKR